MADNLALSIRIGADVAPILAGLKKLDGQYDKTRQELTGQVGKIAALEAAEQGAVKAGVALEEARRKVEFFKRSAEVAGGSGMKAYAKDIEAAKREVLAAAAASEKQQRAIASLRQELVAAGIDTGKLSAEQARLATQLRATDSAQAKARIKAGTLVAPGADVGAAADLLGLKSHAAIQAEIAKTRGAYDTLRASGTLSHRELAQAAGVTRRKIGDLNDQMNGHNATATGLAGTYGLLRAGFYAFQALLVGNAVVRAVDDMRLLEARIKLVSASSDQVKTAMAGVAAIARAASAPIGDVGASYVKYAAAIRTLGGTQEQSLGLTRAVALGLRVSGAAAQETGAAMYQLGQAFNKGKLDGDEFRTMSEAGGKLMDYLAKGLGKTRAELIEMAAAGELTADKMLAGWTKMLPQIEADAASLPETVGSAMTGLSNQFKLFAADSDTLRVSLNAVAGGLRFIGDHLGALASVAVVAGIAAVAANWAKVAVAIRGAAAASALLAASNPILLALSLIALGGIAAYDAIAGKARESEEAQRAEAEKTAEKRKELEDRYANLVARRAGLEKQAAENAKAAQKDILEGQKKAVAEQIRDAEKLRDSLIEAYKKAGEAADEARKKALGLREKAKDKSLDRTAKKQDSELAQLDKQDPIDAELARQKLANEALEQAEYAHARAVEARYAGNTEAAQRYAGEQDRLIQRAEQLAGAFQNEAVAQGMLDAAAAAATRNLYEQAALEEAKAAKAEQQQAALAQQQAANAQALADFQAQLAAVDASMKALAGEKDAIKIQADQAALEQVKADIAAVKAELDKIPPEVRTKIVVERMSAEPLPAKAAGGLITGPGTDTSDNILARLSPGEFVLRAAAVRRWGADKIAALNAGRMPAFAAGGLVTRAVASLPRFADGGLASAGAGLQPINIILPGGKTLAALANPAEARDFAADLRREALKVRG
ncbi:MAG: tape measure protein [Pseudomonadota bacterium]|nr:tape measure protein [Pseudomonadota bacterium]